MTRPPRMIRPLSSLIRPALGLTLCGLFPVVPHASGQATPARAPEASSSGFALPRASGTLAYSVALSEGVAFGYNGANSTVSSTNISGHLGFLSANEKQPFSLVYSGGYLSGSGQPSSFVHSMGVSQVLSFRRFGILFSDDVSYLPANPVSGLTGVPGLGDQGVAPIQTGQSDGGQLLSQYSPRITNTALAGVTYDFTGLTSVSAAGSSGIIRTTGPTGIESNTFDGGVGVTHHINARSSLTANYTFARYSYLAYPLIYNSHGGTIEYTRNWTHNLSTDIAVGPQYSTTTFIPSTLNYSLNASVVYQLRRSDATVSVVRATNSGSGVTLASRSTSVNASATQRVGRFSAVSANISYSENVSLPTLLLPQSSTNALVASLQGSRSVTRTISAFASYTVQHKLPGQNGFTVNALNGTTQNLGFGVTYAPRPHIFGK